MRLPDDQKLRDIIDTLPINAQEAAKNYDLTLLENIRA